MVAVEKVQSQVKSAASQSYSMTVPFLSPIRKAWLLEKLWVS